MSLDERRVSLKAHSKQTEANANYAACLSEPAPKLEVIAIILQSHQHLVHAPPLSAWKESLERKESREREGKPEGTGSGFPGQKCNKVFVTIVILFSYLVGKELKITQMTFFLLSPIPELK